MGFGGGGAGRSVVGGWWIGGSKGEVLPSKGEVTRVKIAQSKLRGGGETVRIAQPRVMEAVRIAKPWGWVKWLGFPGLGTVLQMHAGVHEVMFTLSWIRLTQFQSKLAYLRKCTNLDDWAKCQMFGH